MQMVWFVAGGIITLYALVMAVRTNWNFGNLAVLLCGAVLLAIGIWYDTVRRLAHTRLGRAVTVFVCVCAAGALGMALGIGIYGSIPQTDFTEDAVVILGAGIRGDQVTRTLQRRLDKGLEYAQKNPDALLVVSGGQGPQETVSEAYAMQQYLLAHGIDSARVLMEDQSTSTEENFAFSKRLLDARLGAGYRVVYITNNFHAYRAGRMAKAAGLSAVSYPAGLDWYLVPVSYAREICAVAWMWLTGG